MTKHIYEEEGLFGIVWDSFKGGVKVILIFDKHKRHDYSWGGNSYDCLLYRYGAELKKISGTRELLTKFIDFKI